MSMDRSYAFTILELEPGASQTEIRHAYEHLVQIYHLSRNLQRQRSHGQFEFVQARADKQFKLVQDAYETLTEPAEDARPREVARPAATEQPRPYGNGRIRWGAVAMAAAMIVTVIRLISGGGIFEAPGTSPREDATRIAAGEAFAVAQYDLGRTHATGRGVPRNDMEAVWWYRNAANQGSGVAQYDLGLMYAYGRGVPQNYVTAYMWLTLAMSRPDLEDSDLEIVVQNRDQVAAQLTPDELAEGQRLASAWDAGHPRD